MPQKNSAKLRSLPRQTGWSRFEKAQQIQEADGRVGKMYRNNLYTVVVTPLAGGSPPMVELSVRRNDRQAVHDWRHLQRIKNELVGPECEGTELFPAESRLVDTANQYFLWVSTDRAFRFPWGFRERLVAEGPYSDKAQQRSFDPDARPEDTKTAAELDAMLASAQAHDRDRTR